PGEIIPESWATSSRNGGRDHLGIGGRLHPGITGGFTRNRQTSNPAVRRALRRIVCEIMRGCRTSSGTRRGTLKSRPWKGLPQKTVSSRSIHFVLERENSCKIRSVALKPGFAASHSIHTMPGASQKEAPFALGPALIASRPQQTPSQPPSGKAFKF